MVHEGPARVFDSEDDAIKAIKGGKIVAGDVVVIRYEGTKRRPGNERDAESYFCNCWYGTWFIGCSDHRRTFQWCIQRCLYWTCLTRSSCRRSDCPDRRGDIISINIPELKLEVKVSDEEMAARKAKWQPREPKITTGYLARYAAMVTSGNRGAILEVPKAK